MLGHEIFAEEQRIQPRYQFAAS